jgi:hypothetical protein
MGLFDFATLTLDGCGIKSVGRITRRGRIQRPLNVFEVPET